MRAVPRAAARGLVFLTAILMATASAAGATTWRAVPAKSEIAFEATQLGAAFTGRFDAFEADIRFDPEDLDDARAAVLVMIASVSTGNGDRDAQILGPDWFDSDAHPVARFETTAIRRDGDGYVARAQLTLRDVTRDVELPFALAIDDRYAVMTAELSINRTDFGIGRGQWVDTAVVGDRVTIRIRLEATAD